MRIYFRAIKYFCKDWPLIGFFFLLIAASSFLSLLQSWPMAVLIDSVLPTTPSDDWIHQAFLYVTPDTTSGRVLVLTGMTAGIKIVSDFLSGVRALLNHRIRNYAIMRVRDDLFEKASRTGNEADSMYRVCNDVQDFALLFDTIVNFTVAGVMLSVMCIIMIPKSVTMTVVGLAVSPGLYLANRYYGTRINVAATKAKEADTRMLNAVNSGNKYTYHAETENTANCWLGLQFENEKYCFVVNTIFSMALAVIFGYGGYLVLNNHTANGMTIGTLGVFLDYVVRMWQPLQTLTSFTSCLERARAGLMRVFLIMDS